MSDAVINQKKRNKPIAITDIAISKVPRTRIVGFSDNQNAFIQEQHKEVLRTAKDLCKQYDRNDMEVIILIDSHTWECWSIEGKESRKVNIEDNPDAYNKLKTGSRHSLLLLHNHPSTGTFSGQDFKTFCENDSLYLMTVVGNDGSVYVLIKQFDFDPSSALVEYGKLAVEYKRQGYRNNGTRAINDILKYAANHNLIYKKGRKKL